MSNPLLRRSWSPYVAGAGIGMLSWFAFATVDQPLGITTAFEHTAAITMQNIAPQQAGTGDYVAKKTAEGKPPKIGWEWMVVVGVFAGAFVSSRLSGDWSSETVPPLWRSRFGDSAALRLAVAFLSGVLMMFGARLAQGCTSGHGISGTLQLAVSSWLFIILAFAIATGTTLLLFGGKGMRHV